MDWLYTQGLNSPGKLSQFPFPLRVIYAKYTVPIRIKGQGYPMIGEVSPESFHISTRRFRRGEAQRHQGTGGIINKDDQGASRTSCLKPVMRRTINLDQFALTRTTHASLVDSGNFTPTFTP